MNLIHYRHSGFTLVEIMIVIAIIVFMGSIAVFPYGYYMQRASVERTADTIGQEWILAHKTIRNGKLFDNNILNSKNANRILVFEKGSGKIDSYLLSGSSLPDLNNLAGNPNLKADPSIIFDTPIFIQSFSGTTLDLHTTQKLGYIISAPFATGAFFTGSTAYTEIGGIYLTIGLTGATTDTGRAKKILLRTYLQ